jgi:hypothetical protein
MTSDEIKAAAREVMKPCFCCGYTYKDIAKYFGVNEVTVARISYGCSFSLDMAMKILDKAGFEINLKRKGE